jgi:hypothetical protein
LFKLIVGSVRFICPLGQSRHSGFAHARPETRRRACKESFYLASQAGETKNGRF